MHHESIFEISNLPNAAENACSLWVRKVLLSLDRVYTDMQMLFCNDSMKRKVLCEALIKYSSVSRWIFHD